MNIKRVSALFSTMDEMVVIHEMVFNEEEKPVNYRIIDCNDAFTRITGITRESEAENGEEALQFCDQAKKQGELVCVALFDLTIPSGMGGKETLVKFRELFPETPVFASSGFSEDPSIARPTNFGFADSIRKPFKIDELADMLNKHINTKM